MYYEPGEEKWGTPQSPFYKGDVAMWGTYAGQYLKFFSFCCHTREEEAAIKDAVRKMDWTSFSLDIDDFGCSKDESHAYLHAGPKNRTVVDDLAR